MRRAECYHIPSLRHHLHLVCCRKLLKEVESGSPEVMSMTDEQFQCPHDGLGHLGTNHTILHAECTSCGLVFTKRRCPELLAGTNRRAPGDGN